MNRLDELNKFFVIKNLSETVSYSNKEHSKLTQSIILQFTFLVKLFGVSSLSLESTLCIKNVLYCIFIIRIRIHFVNKIRFSTHTVIWNKFTYIRLRLLSKFSVDGFLFFLILILASLSIFR